MREATPGGRQLFRGRRVVTAGGVGPASIFVDDGRITAVADFGETLSGGERIDLGDLLVMPGLVDTHVHVNEPGRTEWEGFATATRAAAAGGVTTLVDMPLNSVPATTTAAALAVKAAAAEGKVVVDIGFWGGVVPGNAGELRPLWEAGALGFKCFLVPSGVGEFPGVAVADLRQALPELAALGAPLLAHAELPGPIAAATSALAGDPVRSHATWLASRPRTAENEAIAMLLGLCREHATRLHVVHLSSSDALDMLRRARSAEERVTVETCPHYLTFAAEEIPDGATDYKCAPPIRERENNDRLWRALEDGAIDMVVSDHSPCPPAMKQAESGDFMSAWGGIASLELGLAAVWTGARGRGIHPERLAEWMSAAPARLAGLERRKGRLAPGFDADLVVWDPDAAFRVDPGRLHQRHPVTPYAGRELRGVVAATYLRGRKVFDRGDVASQPNGRLLRR
jgi:allantoinase